MKRPQNAYEEIFLGEFGPDEGLAILRMSLEEREARVADLYKNGRDFVDRIPIRFAWIGEAGRIVEAALRAGKDDETAETVAAFASEAEKAESDSRADLESGADAMPWAEKASLMTEGLRKHWHMLNGWRPKIATDVLSVFRLDHGQSRRPTPGPYVDQVAEFIRSLTSDEISAEEITLILKHLYVRVISLNSLIAPWMYNPDDEKQTDTIKLLSLLQEAAALKGHIRAICQCAEAARLDETTFSLGQWKDVLQDIASQLDGVTAKQRALRPNKKFEERV